MTCKKAPTLWITYPAGDSRAVHHRTVSLWISLCLHRSQPPFSSHAAPILFLGYFSKGFFSSTGTFTGMWAAKLKAHYFRRWRVSHQNPKLSELLFSWSHVEAYFIATCHRVLKSHHSDGGLALFKIAPLWLITYRDESCIAGFGQTALQRASDAIQSRASAQSLSEGFLRAAGQGSFCLWWRQKGLSTKEEKKIKKTCRVILSTWKLKEQVFPWGFTQPQNFPVSMHMPICLYEHVC